MVGAFYMVNRKYGRGKTMIRDYGSKTPIAEEESAVGCNTVAEVPSVSPGGTDGRKSEGILTFLTDFEDDTMLGMAALAKRLQVGCTRTIRRMVDRAELPPPVIMGAANYWFVGDIRQWVSARREAVFREAKSAALKIWAMEAERAD